MSIRDQNFNPAIRIVGVGKVDRRDEPPVIEANAICGSVLLLEGVKGVLELTSLWGLLGAQLDPTEVPDVVKNSSREAQYTVLRHADLLEFEVPGLLFGIGLWPTVIT